MSCHGTTRMFLVGTYLVCADLRPGACPRRSGRRRSCCGLAGERSGASGLAGLTGLAC